MSDELEFAGYEWGVRWSESAPGGKRDEWHHCEYSARFAHTTFQQETNLICRPLYRGVVEYVDRPAFVMAASAAPRARSIVKQRRRARSRSSAIVLVTGEGMGSNDRRRWAR